MGLFDLFGRKKTLANSDQLIGSWSAPGVEIDIRRDGTMDYIAIALGKRQIMKLTYQIDGDEIISNQPSAPREERTKFRFQGDQLVLMFDGEETTCRRLTR